MNLAENAIADVKRGAAGATLPADNHEMRALLTRSWNKYTMVRFNSQVDSYPKRIKKLINGKGAPIKY